MEMDRSEHGSQYHRCLRHNIQYMKGCMTNMLNVCGSDNVNVGGFD